MTHGIGIYVQRLTLQRGCSKSLRVQLTKVFQSSVLLARTVAGWNSTPLGKDIQSRPLSNSLEWNSPGSLAGPPAAAAVAVEAPHKAAVAILLRQTKSRISWKIHSSSTASSTYFISRDQRCTNLWPIQTFQGFYIYIAFTGGCST
jgi:hypothetical protein